MRRPYGVIFDFGDTVLHGEFNPAAGFKRLLEFVENMPDFTAEYFQRVADEMSREIGQLRDESMIEFGFQIFQRLLFETLGLSVKTDYLVMEKAFWHAAIAYTPCDGILDVLDILEKYQIKAGILSNSSFTGIVLEEELSRHNLADRFIFVISSVDYGFRKPHNRIFNVAVKKMNLEPHDIWFVGDKLESDVRGAFDYGLYPVWYNPRNEPGKEDCEYLEVRNWHEFNQKIELLCGN